MEKNIELKWTRLKAKKTKNKPTKRQGTYFHTNNRQVKCVLDTEQKISLRVGSDPEGQWLLSRCAIVKRQNLRVSNLVLFYNCIQAYQ